MDKEKIIAELNRHKKLPYLDYRLKQETEDFTDSLFYTLFDANTPVAVNLELLEKKFIRLVEISCWDLDTPGNEIWDIYVSRLPEILEKLNMDYSFSHSINVISI